MIVGPSSASKDPRRVNGELADETAKNESSDGMAGWLDLDTVRYPIDTVPTYLSRWIGLAPK